MSHLSRMKIFSQVSGDHSELCSICRDDEEPVGPGAPAQDIRLACGCAFHFGCIVRYIKTSLGESDVIRSSGGIPCPNSAVTVSTCQYFDIDRKKYILGPEDLDTVIDYVEAHSELANDAILVHDDAVKLRDWMLDSRFLPMYQP